MPRLTRLLAIFVLLVPGATCADKQSKPTYRPVRLGSGKKFPRPEKELLRLRDGQNTSTKMRDHAWDLFAGLTGQSSPAWETWATKCDLGLNAEQCPKTDNTQKHLLFRSLEIPVQFADQLERTSEGETALLSERASFIARFVKDFQHRPQFASVLFNGPAAHHIQRFKLSSKDKLESILAKGISPHSPATKAEVAPFPRGSVVVKTAWQIVSDASGADHKLYVWDPDVWKTKRSNGDYDAMELSQWGNFVSVDTTPGKKCEQDNYADLSSVPLDCFYYYRIQSVQDELSFSAIPAHFVDPVAATGVIQEPNAYLILVAVHVTTKETPDWVWATFWWSNRANDPDFGTDRPDIVKGAPWRHFLMDTTLSRITPIDKLDHKNKICFNPYLEEVFNHGIVSNCIECHRRAVYISSKDNRQRDNGYDLAANARDAIPSNGDSHDVYFDDALQLDFLWSLGPQKAQTDFINSLNEYLFQ